MILFFFFTEDLLLKVSLEISPVAYRLDTWIVEA